MVEEDWPLDRVLEEQRRLDAQGSNLPTRLQPIFIWQALQDLREEERRFRDGDPMALFSAVRICAQHDLVIPEWAAVAFIEGYYEVLQCRAGSWDEVFGVPHPKGTHLDKKRQRILLRPSIYNRVRDIRSKEPNTPIDRALFERVAEEFSIGRTLAEELYYSAKRMFSGVLPD